MTVALLPFPTAPASAAAALSIAPVTWNVVGLDSNNVNSGPNEFLSGARICNTGDAAATNVVATYAWDTANANVNLSGSSTRTKASLAAGSCFDAYFNIVVTRTSAAYNTARRFHITATADSLGTVSTPTPREIFVEKLVSQNRNSVGSITGPSTVYVGGTYTFTVASSTATQGYEQLSSFLNWPGAIFEVRSVAVTYSAPVNPTANDKVYADACGWVNDPASPSYRSCLGSGKEGGTISTTYTVYVIQPGTATLGELIYDFSGSSYHYNSDYGTSVAAKTVTAVASADLSVTKSDSVDPVTAGNQLTYTLDVANAGPSSATGVTLTDAVPAGTSFVSATGGGTESGGTVTWNLGTVASGSSTSVTVTVAVAASRTASLSNTASVTSSVGDANSANNSDTETTGVQTSADLSLTKTGSPDPVGVGEDLTYTLGLRNDGPSDAQSVVVTDTLPAGVTFVSATPSVGTCTRSGVTLTCTLGTVAAGATPSISVLVRPNAGSEGTITNSATVSSTTSDPDLGDRSPSADTTVQPRADVSISKSDTPDPVVAGNQVTYTLAIANAGPSTATGVTVTDPIPAGATFVSATGGGTLSSGTVTWNLGSLASGGSTSVQLVVAVDSSRLADLSNTATVSTSTTDPVSGNNSSTQTTTVDRKADLSITKTDAPDPVAAGQTLTYNLAVSNSGPSYARNVSVGDVLPAGVTFVSATPSQGSCSESSGTVTCALGTIADGAGATIAIKVTPTVAGSLSNTATVSSTTTDPAPGNNASTAGTTVTPVADVSVSVSDSADPADAGTQLTYTYLVHNAGPSSAASVALSTAVPAGTTFVSATGGGSLSSGTVSWNLGTVASGGSTIVTMVVAIDPSRTAALSDIASVSTSTPDANAANDSDTEPTAIATPADVGIVKSDLSDPVVAGEDLTYRLDVTNHGPAIARNVVVDDVVPAGTSFVSATGGGTESAGMVSWSLGDLAAGTTTVYVTVHVNAGRSAALSNTASVNTSSVDQVPANDDSTEGTTVQRVADLSVTKSDGLTIVAPGDTVTYTITLSNAGPSTAPAGVVVSDTLPAEAVGSESEPDCAIAAGVLTCTTSSGLVPGGSVSWDVDVAISPGFLPASLSNTAAVTSSPVSDPDGSNDSATDTDLLPNAAIDVAASSTTASVGAGGQVVDYTFTVTNAGNQTLTGVTVTDPDCDPGTLVYAGGDANNDAKLQLAETWTYTCERTVTQAEVDAGGPISTSVDADSAESAPATDSVDVPVTLGPAMADLQLTKTDLVDPVLAGEQLTYQIQVTNAGLATATGVVVTDPLPAGTTFASATAGGIESGGIVTWSLGSVLAGDTVTLQVVVDVDPGATGTLSNTATVTSNTSDADPTNDADSETTGLNTMADLSILKQGPATFAPGGSFTYTMTITNDGPSDALDVMLTDPLPTGLEFVSASNGGTEMAGTVTWDLGTIANGGSLVVSLETRVQTSFTGKSLKNTASVSASSPDPDVNDWSSSAAARKASGGNRVNLSVRKTVDDPTPTAGQVIGYRIEVTNHGPADATGVVIKDVLPDGLTYQSSSASRGQFHPSTGLWDVGKIPDGEHATLSMKVKVTGSGAITNIASVSDVDQTDSNGSDDRGSAKVTVAGTGGSLAVTGLAIARFVAWMLVLVGLGMCCLTAARRLRRDPEAG